MKKIFLILFCFPVFCFGQQGFHIGAFGNNGAFWLYNFSDFHADNPLLCETISPEAFQFENYKIGLSTGYGISEKCAINCDLLFSNYFQKYKRATGVDYQNGDTAYVNYMTAQTKIQYLTILPEFEFDFANSTDRDVIPYLKGGIQLSYLINYNHKEYLEWDNGQGKNTWSFENNNNRMNLISESANGLHYEWNNKSENIFHTLNWGASINAGLKINISEYFNIDFSLRGTYDFRNTDNLEANIYSSDSVVGKYWIGRYYNFSEGTDQDKTRRTSHNIYVGFGIGFNYYFRSRYDNY